MDLPSQDTPAAEPRAEEQTLLALLSTLAHRANDTQLVVLCGASLLSGVAILLFARDWWRLSLPLATLACFAVWAIAERDGSRRPAARALQMLAAVAGVLCAFAFGLGLLASALGTWIS